MTNDNINTFHRNLSAVKNSFVDACNRVVPYYFVKAPLTIDLPGLDAIPVNKHDIIVAVDKTTGDMAYQLNPVGKHSYTVTQFEEAMLPIKPLLDRGVMEIARGGLVRNGSLGFLQCDLKDGIKEIAKGETIEGRFIASTGFDGGAATKYGGCSTAAICANTLAMALRQTGQATKLVQQTAKHTRGVHQAIERIAEQVDKVAAEFARSIEAYTAMTKAPVTKAEVEVYVRHVLGKAPATSEKESTRSENTIRHVLELADGKQIGFDAVPARRGTVWGAYNAVTQYLSHDYGNSTNEADRIESNLFGSAARINSQAFVLAMAMV
jgi:phage/plasmid-like protein (TIGR03299 family)